MQQNPIFLKLIEDYCVENEIIDEVEENPTAETAETAKVLKLKLEFEHEERQLVRAEVREEAQRACEATEAEAQRACKAARKIRLADLREAVGLHESEL